MHRIGPLVFRLARKLEVVIIDLHNSPMFRIARKLKAIKIEPHNWNKTTVANYGTQVEKIPISCSLLRINFVNPNSLRLNG